ncbi:MAG: hypothetical protein Q8Q60_01235 [Candidatus Chromulinivorax sp.]|nr:hypothetical protein [Candidatus Chromulinivorax sp.]
MKAQLLLFLSIYSMTHYLEAMEAKVELAARPKPISRSTSSMPTFSSMKSWFSTTWTNENKVAVGMHDGEFTAMSARNSKSIIKKSAPINFDGQPEHEISPRSNTDETISSKDTLKSKQVSFDESVQMIPVYQKEPVKNLSQTPVRRVLKSAPQTNLYRIQEPQGTFDTKIERPRPGLKITEFYNKNNLLIGRATECSNPKGYPKNTAIIIEERLNGSTTCHILYPDSTIIMEYKNDILTSVNYQNPAGFPLGTTINVIKTKPMLLTATMIEPGTQESPLLKIEYTIKYNADGQPISIKIKEVSHDQTEQISFNYNKKGDLQMYKNSMQDTYAEVSFATQRKNQLDLHLDKFNRIMKKQPSMPIIQ